jgi:ABC-type uncharacterized transport system permease subunit
MTSVLSTGTFLVALLLYGAAGSLFFLDVARREGRLAHHKPSPEAERRGRLAPLLLGAAAVGHAAYVVIASLVAKVCPINSVHFSLSIASLFATGVYLGARRRFRIDALGVLLAPLGLVFLLGTFFLGQPALPSPSLGPVFLSVHVIANLVGTGLFFLAGGAAALYLVQEKRLKQKRPAVRAGGLPPLEVLDKAVHRFLVAGFPLLTIGIVTGTFWAHRLETGGTDDVLRVVLGYTTWVLIAGVLLLRAAVGWRGRRAAYGTIAGLVGVAAVLVVYLVRPAAQIGAAKVGG